MPFGPQAIITLESGGDLIFPCCAGGFAKGDEIYVYYERWVWFNIESLSYWAATGFDRAAA